MGSDDGAYYDMVARRFLAVFHPEAVIREHTRGDDRGATREQDDGHIFRTRGKLLLVPGWRGVYDEVASDARPKGEEDEASISSCPGWVTARQVQTNEIAADRKETKPPRR